MRENDKLLYKTLKTLLNEKLSDSEVQSLMDEGFQVKNPTRRIINLQTNRKNKIKANTNSNFGIIFAVTLTMATIMFRTNSKRSKR